MLKAFLASLEWRFYAFVLTVGVLIITGNPLTQATKVAVLLQAVLLIAHTIWFHRKQRTQAVSV